LSIFSGRDSGFRVFCTGIRVWLSGSRVQGLEFWVQCAGFEIQGLWSRFHSLGSGSTVYGSDFKVSGGVLCLWFGIWGSEIRDQGSGSNVQGLGFKTPDSETFWLYYQTVSLCSQTSCSNSETFLLSPESFRLCSGTWHLPFLS
jgi:hypothetical protein